MVQCSVCSSKLLLSSIHDHICPSSTKQYKLATSDASPDIIPALSSELPIDIFSSFSFDTILDIKHLKIYFPSFPSSDLTIGKDNGICVELLSKISSSSLCVRSFDASSPKVMIIPLAQVLPIHPGMLLHKRMDSPPDECDGISMRIDKIDAKMGIVHCISKESLDKSCIIPISSLGGYCFEKCPFSPSSSSSEISGDSVSGHVIPKLSCEVCYQYLRSPDFVINSCTLPHSLSFIQIIQDPPPPCLSGIVYVLLDHSSLDPISNQCTLTLHHLGFKDDHRFHIKCFPHSYKLLSCSDIAKIPLQIGEYVMTKEHGIGVIVKKKRDKYKIETVEPPYDTLYEKYPKRVF
ncbi:hypothetical protein ADUPG1_009532 [Aduncisulcus paluster]|uniref:Uncharacterized protein n=1 Tax=Aduncisulcus paluster TaxID=2918883 RepID=A0ABQ5KY66_9EUKA|nr:hypothetical protein ADUPG1_009532 [Aduncisulcus paluster]